MSSDKSGGAHTPGPWRGHDMEGDTIVAAHTGNAIAVVFGRSLSEAENAANFRLIRSAPDLLAALEDMANDFEAHIGCTTHSIEVARAAIRKATGGT